MKKITPKEIVVRLGLAGFLFFVATLLVASGVQTQKVGLIVFGGLIFLLAVLSFGPLFRQ